MKFKLHQLTAAAVITASLAGHANAASVTAALGDVSYLNGASVKLLQGSGTLSYSSGYDFDGTPNTIGGLIGALNVGNVQVRDVNGVIIEETFVPDEFGEEPVRIGVTAKAKVSSYTYDDITGKIQAVTSVGGARHTGTRISGTLTGGVATVTNLRFDLANKLVYADLAGTKAAVGTNPAVNYSLPDTALWTIGSVSGPTTIDPAALALTGQARIDAFVAQGFTYARIDHQDTFTADNLISGLKVTTAGFDFFVNTLGLLSTGRGALAAVNNDPQGWGWVSSSLTFAVPVPEPSTYAMLGAGLLVAGGALRARRRA